MRALAAAIALALGASAAAQTPGQPSLPQPEESPILPVKSPSTSRTSLLLAGGWEEARLQDVPFSGPSVLLGVLLARPEPRRGLGLRLRLHLSGRRGETPEGLAGVDLRLGALGVAERGRFGLGLGVDLVRVMVERVGPGSMGGTDLALRLSATFDLLHHDRGALYLELAGSISGDTRQRTGAILLGHRFHAN